MFSHVLIEFSNHLPPPSCITALLSRNCFNRQLDDSEITSIHHQILLCFNKTLLFGVHLSSPLRHWRPPVSLNPHCLLLMRGAEKTWHTNQFGKHSWLFHANQTSWMVCSAHIWPLPLNLVSLAAGCVHSKICSICRPKLMGDPCYLACEGGETYGEISIFSAPPGSWFTSGKRIGERLNSPLSSVVLIQVMCPYDHTHEENKRQEIKSAEAPNLCLAWPLSHWDHIFKTCRWTRRSCMEQIPLLAIES